MRELRRHHASIMRGVGQVQDRTSHILQEQERDLLRAFRARLFDVQSELEKERNRSDDGSWRRVSAGRSRSRTGWAAWTSETDRGPAGPRGPGGGQGGRAAPRLPC